MTDKHPFGAIKFNSVVYLGAGNGESLSELLAQVKADHWHLVEGDSKKYKRLQQAADTLESNDKIKLHNCVVSDDGTQKTWFSFNLGEFSGLKKAKDLAKLFPGIKLKHQSMVDTEALPNFLEQLELSSKESNLLIIDLPGQVLELIEAILKAGQKPLFSQLVLTATKEQVFEHGGTLERIQQWLDKQSYHTRNEPYDDPDFPVLYYSFDKDSAAEFTKLKRQLKQLANERDEAIDRASSAEQERDNAVARASGTRKELEQLHQQLNETSERAKSAETKLKDLEQSLADANDERQKHIDWAHDLKAQLDKATSRASNAEQERDEALASVSGTSKNLEQAKKERDEQAHWHQKNKEWAKSLKVKLESTEREVEQKKQQLQEQTYRNQMLEREVVKLEAQVEFIAEIISRAKES